MFSDSSVHSDKIKNKKETQISLSMNDAIKMLSSNVNEEML